MGCLEKSLQLEDARVLRKKNSVLGKHILENQNHQSTEQQYLPANWGKR
jgi:hypothetical protein